MGSGIASLRAGRVRLLVPLLVLIALIGAVETIGFLWERHVAQGPLGWSLVASRRLDFASRGTPDKPYYLLAPNREYSWEGIDVRINSRGLRGPEVDLEKSKEVDRILLLGDSVVFGWEVDSRDVYGTLLEGILNQDKPVKVISVGVPGWTLESARNFFFQEGQGYQPHQVLLSVSIVNDIYGTPPEPDKVPAPLRFLRTYSYGWPFLTINTRFLVSMSIGPRAIPVLNPPLEAEAYFPLDWADPVWDVVWEPVDEIAKYCAEKGIDFSVVMFPTALQVNRAAEHPDFPQQVFKEKAARSDIPLVDLLPVYKSACREAQPNACEKFENLLFADVWMHPNSFGHRLAAETLGTRWTSDHR